MPPNLITPRRMSRPPSRSESASNANRTRGGDYPFGLSSPWRPGRRRTCADSPDAKRRQCGPEKRRDQHDHAERVGRLLAAEAEDVQIAVGRRGGGPRAEGPAGAGLGRRRRRHIHTPSRRFSAAAALVQTTRLCEWPSFSSHAKPPSGTSDGGSRRTGLCRTRSRRAKHTSSASEQSRIWGTNTYMPLLGLLPSAHGEGTRAAAPRPVRRALNILLQREAEVLKN